jgi:acyl-CoA synthetase (AMP-forming)/AMP-acid ligase II
MSEHVGAALERAAQLFGERVAVVDGQLRWTYRDLQARVAGLILGDPAAMAHGLSSLRSMLYGASPMPEPLLRRVMAAFPCDWGRPTA